MFVSPLQGRVTKKKGWKASPGRETKGGSFNVCLPREAIKINTSNYQAVLNFLGATKPRHAASSVTPSPLHHHRHPLPPPPSPSPPLFAKLRSVGGGSTNETDFPAFTCILLPPGPAITRRGSIFKF